MSSKDTWAPLNLKPTATVYDGTNHSVWLVMDLLMRAELNILVELSVSWHKDSLCWHVKHLCISGLFSGIIGKLIWFLLKVPAVICQTDRQTEHRTGQTLKEFTNPNQTPFKNTDKCQWRSYGQVTRAKRGCCLVSPGLLEVSCSWWTMSMRPLFVPHSNLPNGKTRFAVLLLTKPINIT